LNTVDFIAEVSSNHSRDLERSLRFIECAADVGCSSVKFQLFRVDELFAPNALPPSEVKRRKNWELPLEFLPELARHCRKVGIQFSCTPFYLDAVRLLEPHVAFFKIASYELLWDDLLVACARTGKPVILSTGMATMEEIERAVAVLKRSGCAAPTLLHAVSSYPAPHSEANLAAIESIRRATGCEVGWSDHTVEPAVIQRAIHRWGATAIEFHLDLDGKGEEFAGRHCWLPDQIAPVIRDVKKGLEADGRGIKEPVPSELHDRMWRADPSDGLRPLLETRKQWK